MPRQPVYYAGPDGQLLVPASGGVQRSSSVSGQRPPHINIYNDYAASWDDHSGRRPSSAHGSLYYDEVEDRVYRAGPRVRRPSASPSRELDPETKEKLKQYDDLKKKEEEKAQQKRIEEKLLMDRIKREAELAEREKEEKELKKKAIEEYKLKEEEERIKKQKEKEREDEEFRERMRKTLWANGYSAEQIDRMMKKAEKKSDGDSSGRSTTALVLNRPTYIKVHRKHLDPETLDVYQLPWEWDDVGLHSAPDRGLFQPAD